MSSIDMVGVESVIIILSCAVIALFFVVLVYSLLRISKKGG